MKRQRSNGPRNSDRMTLNDRMPGKRICKHLEGVENVDYKDHELLRKFMTERGKIMSRRTTYATAKQQRQIKRAIRRARIMGLLP